MLTETANKIFKAKYAQGNETWADCSLRVATYVANGNNEITNKFFQMIYNLYFLPGGRILANAGTGIKNLMNCFFRDLDDSRDSIYTVLKEAAEIFAWGGGQGFNFSRIREEGAKVRTTGGRSSGPLSFMSLFDQTGEVISQASRRGAMIGLLDVNHPDILKFIDFKSIPNSRNKRILEEYDNNLKRFANGKLKNTKYYDVLEKTLLDDQLTHFNLSVVLSDEFMQAVEDDHTWDLVSPLDGQPKETIVARDLFRKMAHQTWTSGDPGLFFTGRVNRDNIVQPYMGDIHGTNPCGEISLLNNEACCLGSINLHKLYVEETNNIDWVTLEEVVRLSIRFLDNVQDLSYTVIEKINETCRGLRRLGLGVFGWADLLAELGLAYDSEEAFKLAEYISWFISFFAWQESIEMAKEKGPFLFYDADKVNLDVVERTLNSKFSPGKFDIEGIRRGGIRNVSVTALAPTGSISLISGVSGAVIEPFFALAYRRYITEGVGNIAKDTIVEINPILFRKLKKLNLSEEDMKEITEHVLKFGTIQNCTKIPGDIRVAFKTAHDLNWQAHLEMQARWQSFVSNSVSKTINLPHDATEEDVYNCFVEAWKKGVKGLTAYRDGSRNFQILNVGTEEKDS